MGFLNEEGGPTQLGEESVCNASRRQGHVAASPLPQLPRAAMTDHAQGPGSGLNLWGRHAYCRRLVSHWDPGLLFISTWTRPYSAAVFSRHLGLVPSQNVDSEPSMVSGVHVYVCVLRWGWL